MLRGPRLCAALCRRCLRRPSRALPAPEVQEWEAGWPGGQGKKKRHV